MSKFNDRIERDLHQIADQASPSSNAWQTIQQRMAEPDTTGTRDVIMLTAEDTEVETPNQGRRWLAIAASIAIVAIAAAALLRSGDDDTPIIADQPDEQSETTEAPTTEAPTTEQPTTTVAEEEAQVIVPGLPLKAGAVTTDLLGETLTMELPEDMVVAYARPGEIQLNGTTEVPKILVIARVGGWYSGTEAIDNTYRGEGSIDPADPQAWIDDNGVIGERRPGFLEVSGRIATIWDISVDPDFEGSLYDDCPKCMLVYTVSSEFFDAGNVQESSRMINADVTMRMYFFEGADGADPFVFFAAGFVDDASFIDEFEETIFPTIGFEPEA